MILSVPLGWRCLFSPKPPPGFGTIAAGKSRSVTDWVRIVGTSYEYNLIDNATFFSLLFDLFLVTVPDVGYMAEFLCGDLHHKERVFPPERVGTYALGIQQSQILDTLLQGDIYGSPPSS